MASIGVGFHFASTSWLNEGQRSLGACRVGTPTSRGGITSDYSYLTHLVTGVWGAIRADNWVAAVQLNQTDALSTE